LSSSLRSRRGTYPQLAVLEIAVAVGKRGLTQPDRLDLGADQHYAGDILLDDLVVERRPFVAYVYVFIIGHISHSYIRIEVCRGANTAPHAAARHSF